MASIDNVFRAAAIANMWKDEEKKKENNNKKLNMAKIAKYIVVLGLMRHPKQIRPNFTIGQRSFSGLKGIKSS